MAIAPAARQGPPHDEDDPIRAGLKDAWLNVIGMSRDLAQVTRRVAGDTTPEVEVARRSLAERLAPRPPKVSVVVASYNHGRHVRGALESVAMSTERDFEIVVVDDGSSDDTASVLDAFLAERPETRLTVLRHTVNLGLPVARNNGVAASQGERCFILDADNEVRPTCLERLGAALDGDPDAWFAFCLLECFDDAGTTVRLGNADGPGLAALRSANTIDAMALVRRERILELGGYTTDLRLYGLEDYDLWCAVAEAGGHAVQVLDVLARYRVSSDSMLSITGLSKRRSDSALRERHPRLFAEA
jgi:GT2 family glycosyltransferase